MTSLQTSIKQVPTQGGNFVTLAANIPVLTLFTDANGVTGSFSNHASLNNILPVASLLRDEGRTVVSSGLTFRKVQLVSSIGAPGVYGYSNAGVGGAAATATDATGYFTGYIQLGVGGGRGAAVARV